MFNKPFVICELRRFLYPRNIPQMIHNQSFLGNVMTGPKVFCEFARSSIQTLPTLKLPGLVLKPPKATSLSQRDMDRITDRLCGRTVNPCIWSCRSASRGFIIKDEHFKVEGLRRNSPGLEAHLASFALYLPLEGGNTCQMNGVKRTNDQNYSCPRPSCSGP